LVPLRNRRTAARLRKIMPKKDRRHSLAVNTALTLGIVLLWVCRVVGPRDG
jgi:hypothetical protein